MILSTGPNEVSALVHRFPTFVYFAMLKSTSSVVINVPSPCNSIFTTPPGTLSLVHALTSTPSRVSTATRHAYVLPATTTSSVPSLN